MAMNMTKKWTGGHSDSVICLAHSIDDIASGGEDQQICIWSNEGKIISKLSLQDDVTSLCFLPSNPNVLYAACGNKVNLLDVRDFSHVQMCREFNSEEINEIAVNLKETFIANCDDSGDVKVIDLKEMRLFKTLKRHKNICSSVKFHPTKGCELLSAGLDCHINWWDFMKGRNIGSFNMHECPTEDDGIPAGLYMVNPPLVHSMAISDDGSKVMCGLENGRVQVFTLSGRGRLEPLCVLKGHTRGVSNVQIQETELKEVLITGGNDGKVILWEGNKQKSTHRRKKNVKMEGTARKYAVDEVNLNTSNCSHILLKTIDHGSKINGLLSATIGSKTFVFVADQSESICVYDVSDSILVKS